MTHWLAMGGYAIYVWPAYAVFFAVLAWDWFAPALRRHRLTRELRGRFARERTRNARAARAEAST
ncbi:MAG TPA: heme exporter protein CcmD [Rhodanobacteraceae bacterium]|nr:heme exporter protein CcmD [Rhodanobacteraceae bacterium]